MEYTFTALLLLFITIILCLQCFDAVSWVAERSCGL